MPEKKNPIPPYVIVLLLVIAVSLSLLVLLLMQYTCRTTAPEIQFDDPGTSLSSEDTSAQPSSQDPSPSSQTISRPTSSKVSSKTPSKSSSRPTSSAVPSSSSEVTSSDAPSSSAPSSSTAYPAPSLPPFPSNPPSEPESSRPVSSNEITSTPVSSAASSAVSSEASAPVSRPSSSGSSISSPSSDSSHSSSQTSSVVSSATSSVSSTPTVEIVEEVSRREGLSPRNQILYDIFLDNFQWAETLFTTGNYESEDIVKTYQAVYLDHPELYFLPHDLTPSFLAHMATADGIAFFVDYPQNSDTIPGRIFALQTQAQAIVVDANCSTKLELAQYLCDTVVSGRASHLEHYYTDRAAERTLLLLFKQAGLPAQTDLSMNANEIYRYTLTVTINGTAYTFDPRP